MANNKLIRIGPVPLSTTLTTNILNPAITSLAGPIGVPTSQPYLILKHVRILNTAAVPATFSLWLGATGANAAGTSVLGTGKSIAANDVYDWYGTLRLDAADFLVGGANQLGALVLQAEGELGFS